MSNRIVLGAFVRVLPPEAYPVVALSSGNIRHDPVGPFPVSLVLDVHSKVIHSSSSFPGMVVSALIFHFTYYLTMWYFSVVFPLLFYPRDTT